MTMKTNYGIIGCGMMGHEHLKNIALLDSTNIAAIYEPDVAMAKSASKLAPNAEMSTTLEELLNRDDLDCLVIASPNFLHMEQLTQISQHPARPILVEKPLFTDQSDVPALEKFNRDYPAPVWVAMEYRYMPPIAALIEEAEAATGGIKMLTIREHRFPFLEKVNDWNRFNKFSGGTFVEKCCHFFDLIRVVIKSEPIRVLASAAQDVNHLDEEYDGEVPDILDNGYAIVDFDNGARAMLELCMFAEGARYQEETSAVGPKGKIEAFVPGPGRFWPKRLGSAPVPHLITSPRHPRGPIRKETPVDSKLLEAGDHNGSTFYQHEKFLQLVRGEINQPEVSFLDGWKAVALGLAAQESASQHRVVELSGYETYPKSKN